MGVVGDRPGMSRLEFDAGVALVRLPSARSPVLHRLACDRLAAASTAQAPAESYWIDARNAASTHVLYECAEHRRSLAGLRVARAFTAYQHHSLVRRVARVADDPALLVAPNVAAPYADGDLRAWEREDLLDATLTTLRELGRALACPVLVSAVDEERADRVAEVADYDLAAVETREGVRLEGEGVRTRGYVRDGWWQTTIPYWVDLCGVADAIRPDPVAAYDRDLLAVEEWGPAGVTDPDRPHTEVSA